MLFTILFEFYAYTCILLFILGSIYKITKTIKSTPYLNKEDENIAKYVNMGIITLVFLHFAGYFVAREIFLLIGLSGDLQSKLARMVSGLIVAFFLTYIVIVICKKYFKNQVSFKGSIGEKIMSLIIVLHILLGFLAIGASTTLEDKALKSIGFSNYFNALFSFKKNPSQYLENLKWLTLSHLLLGYSLIAVLPFTRIIDMIIYRLKQIYIKIRGLIIFKI
ncbi:MAG: respiratory nitrate reductase subunit gamma [Alphaproteobacteria bacterium]|jgi:nitrate reductase gamma subunit|nr:respiratory nitrate reductase subunit gamma [Alphaproteobacteria bacterium]